MNSEITIRKARLSDAQALAEMLSVSYRDTMSGIALPAAVDEIVTRFYTPEALREEMQKPGWNGYYLALHLERIIGAGGGAFLPPTSSEVYALYVEPVWRQRGVGRLLLTAITTEMAAQGAYEQWVTVHPQNGKGIPFYRELGFEVMGRHLYENGVDQDVAPHAMLRFRRILTSSS